MGWSTSPGACVPWLSEPSEPSEGSGGGGGGGPTGGAGMDVTPTVGLVWNEVFDVFCGEKAEGFCEKYDKS